MAIKAEVGGGDKALMARPLRKKHFFAASLSSQFWNGKQWNMRMKNRKYENL